MYDTQKRGNETIRYHAVHRTVRVNTAVVQCRKNTPARLFQIQGKIAYRIPLYCIQFEYDVIHAAAAGAGAVHPFSSMSARTADWLDLLEAGHNLAQQNLLFKGTHYKRYS